MKLLLKNLKPLLELVKDVMLNESLSTSDIAFYAAQKAIADAQINPEELRLYYCSS